MIVRLSGFSTRATGLTRTALAHGGRSEARDFVVAILYKEIKTVHEKPCTVLIFSLVQSTLSVGSNGGSSSCSCEA